jgi:glycosyltransferase involved in cell wall biosynthesis
MRIAQIGPLMESVPPRFYGGTERIVSYLTEELVSLGHQVSLFASGDSVTTAELVACCPRAIRLDQQCRDYIPYYMLMLDKVRSRAADFDILHFHIDHFHFPVFRSIAGRTLTTIHGRLDSRDCLPLYAGFSDMPLVSISQSQREPLPHANFAATVYHGLPSLKYQPNMQPGGGYFAFLGRISPEKGPVEAIRIARALGVPLKIAAKVDKVDEAYFREVVQPLLDEPGIEYIGEIGEMDKGQFLRDAIALLFPICWPEPFGIVLLEAMACGTPTLAFRRGSVPEVIDVGVTGLIVDDVDQGIAAMPKVIALDRAKVRRRFDERFSARRMANDYVRVYRSLLRKAATSPEQVLSGEKRVRRNNFEDFDSEELIE